MTQTPANWYPDPLGRYELRYWDGGQWSDYVANQGVQGFDPLVAAQLEQAAQSGGMQGGGTVLTEPVLVVSHRARVVDGSDEHAVSDRYGRQVGAVREIRPHPAKKALRLFGSSDQTTASLEIADADGQVVLQVTRPTTVLKGRVAVVQDGAGEEIGHIVPQSVWGKVRFSLESGGHQYGAIDLENRHAWDFDVHDETGTEVARISKHSDGVARGALRTADDYAVCLHRPLEDPLRSLVVAAALALDTTLKQDLEGWD